MDHTVKHSGFERRCPLEAEKEKGQKSVGIRWATGMDKFLPKNY